MITKCQGQIDTISPSTLARVPHFVGGIVKPVESLSFEPCSEF